MANNTNQTIPGNFEFTSETPTREARLIVRQWCEQSRKHGDNGRAFSMTIVRDERGYVSIFTGNPAGRVKDDSG